MNRYIVGVDVGGTNIEFVLSDIQRNILKQSHLETDRRDSGQHILPMIADQIKQFQEAFPQGTIEAVGLAIPGVVDRHGYTKACVNLGWHEKNIKEDLFALCGIPVFVLNDANAAVLGEQLFGAAKGSEQCLFVAMGTGLGAGLLLNNRIHTGSHDFAGELGHIHCDAEDTIQCACGGVNCLETFVSQIGLKSRFSDQDIDIKTLFDRAKKGEKRVGDYLEKQFYHLSKALLNITVLLDIDTVILGGGIALAGDYLVDLIYKPMYEIKPQYTILPTIRCSELGSYASVYGALGYALKGGYDD